MDEDWGKAWKTGQKVRKVRKRRNGEGVMVKGRNFEAANRDFWCLYHMGAILVVRWLTVGRIISSAVPKPYISPVLILLLLRATSMPIVP